MIGGDRSPTFISDVARRGRPRREIPASLPAELRSRLVGLTPSQLSILSKFFEVPGVVPITYLDELEKNHDREDIAALQNYGLVQIDNDGTVQIPHALMHLLERFFSGSLDKGK